MLHLSLLVTLVVTSVVEGSEHIERHPNDGWFNNLLHPDWGAIDTILLRMSKADFADGSYEPSGSSRPNPLEISNVTFNGKDDLGSLRNRNALLVYFGQQLVEEIVDAQRPGCPREYFNIKVPVNHPYNPEGHDDLTMPFLRSRYDQRTGHSPNNPRQQLNEITPYIDGNLFYGAGKAWEDALRSFKDGMLLATSSDVKEAFPPENDIKLPFANPPIPRDHVLKPVKRFRRYGNPRTHENPFLNALGLVWFRYHNHIAATIKGKQPTWNDEQIFNAARKRVIGQYQKIVWYEWLPVWLQVKDDGKIVNLKEKYPYHGGQLSKYRGYEPTLHPGITVEFQAAAMRYGHTLVPSRVFTQTIEHNACQLTEGNNTNVTDSTGRTTPTESIRLCNSFWVPEESLEGSPGASSVVLGMMFTKAAREDHIIVSDLREHTFGPLEWSRRDLGALNIQRGRDHGLPGYNDVRKAYGLDRKETWKDISARPQVQSVLDELSSLHERHGITSPDDLDVFAGGLLETTEDGPGELFSHIILEQFLRIRHGDRFWYENRENELYTEEEISEIDNTTFWDVLYNVLDSPVGDKRDNIFICASSPDYANCHCFESNAEASEECVPLRHYDYFTGSEASYIVVVLILIISIAVTCLVMFGMARRRIAIMEEHAASSKKLDIKPAGLNQFYATEWVGRSSHGHLNKRDILVELNSHRLKIFVSNYSGQVVRMIDLRKRSTWTHGQSNVFMRVSCDKEYRLLIFNVPGEIDMVLHFPTQHERDGAMNKLDAFFKQHSWDVEQGQPMAEHLMWRDATTVDERREILAKFFRGVLKELSNEGDHDDVDSNKRVEEDVLKTQLTRTEFAEALGLQPQSLFVRNMFVLADTDKGGSISFDEFKNYFGVLCSGTPESKAEMFFKMFDTGRDGKLTKENYKNMMKSMSEMNEQGGTSDSDLDIMVDKVFERAGQVNQGYLTLKDFKKVFLTDATDVWKTAVLNMQLNGQSMPTIPTTGKRHQPVMERAVSVYADYKKATFAKHLSTISRVSSSVNMTSQAKAPATGWLGTRYNRFTQYIDNHWRQIFWLSLYITVTIGIFVERLYYFSFEREHAGLRRITSYGVSITRGAASAQMFTFASILITMCRNTLTYLRETFLHHYIPFDYAHDMHTCIGYIAVFFSVMHVVGHMFNFYHISTQPSTDMNCYFREFFRSSDTLASFHYWVFTTVTGLTGLALTVFLVIMVVFSVPYARRNVFNAFALTHKLFYAVFILMFLHGAGRLVQEPYWAYFFLGPMVLYFLDKMVSVSRIKVLIPVHRVTILPSEVINLVFKRPLGFDYQSGQWVRIACPQLGSSEYHPFTLTSSPHEESLSLHIRAVGPWTNNLRALFKQQAVTRVIEPQLFLDGPFGESHQDWYRFPVSVLIGGGIGITPFASILKDIAHGFKHGGSGNIYCKKVFFLWVTRTQRSFEWMTDILQQVEAADTADFVNIDIFITQMKTKFDLRTAILYVCEKHFQKVAGISMFTGLRARTHFGRPRFQHFFQALKNEYRNVNQIGVFGCGPPAMTRSVKIACTEANAFTGPSLQYHYENF